MILYPEKIPLLEMDLIGWYWNSVEKYQPVLVDFLHYSVPEWNSIERGMVEVASTIFSVFAVFQTN